jgi:cell wall-associated NlpC family hydrolase
MIVDWAKKYIGLEYKLGHTGPKYFDCWGLIVWVYRKTHRFMG